MGSTVALKPVEEKVGGGHHDLALPAGLDSIVLRRNRFAHALESAYRVYKTEKEYDLVPANSALEAMEKAEIKSPYKIQREMLDYYSALSEKEIAESEESVVMVPDEDESRLKTLGSDVVDQFLASSQKDGFYPLGWHEVYREEGEPQAAPPTESLPAEDVAVPENEVAASEEMPAAAPESVEGTTEAAMSPESESAEVEAVPAESAAISEDSEALSSSEIESLLRND